VDRSFEGTVRVWDASTGAEVAKLEGHGGVVTSVAWSGEGEGARLASGGDNGTVRVWDASTGAEVAKLEGHRGPVTSVTWSGEGEGARLASGGYDGTVRVWDASTGAEVAKLEGQSGRVMSVAWSGEGEGARLASVPPIKEARAELATLKARMQRDPTFLLSPEEALAQKAHASAQLAASEAAVLELRLRGTERERELEEVERGLVVEIQKLGATVAARDNSLAERDAELDAKDEQMAAQVRQVVAACTEQLTSMDEQLTSKDEQLTSKDAEIAWLKRRLDAK